VKWASEAKPDPENCRTAHLSVLITVHSYSTQYTIQHRTVLIISPLTSRETS